MNTIETGMILARGNHTKSVSHNGGDKDLILQTRPIRSEIQVFFSVLFGYCDGLIPCRSFPEKDNNCKVSNTSYTRPPRNIWIKADDAMVSNAYDFAKLANAAGTGCYVIPGTVAKAGQAKSIDILQMQTLLIDIDNGNTEEKLQILKESLREPTLIVKSGGITDCQNKKLHIYWQLTKAVQGEELQQLLQLRYKIAVAVGGDLHFKSAHQPIRVAGSIYHKGAGQKLVKIRSYNRVEYSLTELIRNVEALLKTISKQLPGDAGKHLPKSENMESLPINQILTGKVYAGGVGKQTRFCILSKVIGYWIRRCHDGLVSKEEAINEITGYNLANVVPSWPDIKLERMITGLWQTHLEKSSKHAGIIKPYIELQQQDNDNVIEPWSPVNWQENPPERDWIIDNWLPRGYVTALYGDGGIGKSLLAQQLITALAVGKSFLGINLKPMRVYALMCEDDYSELWRRQTAINQHYQIGMQDLGNIRLISRLGKNNLLMNFDNNNNAHHTRFFDSLYEDIIKYKPDLVVLDTAADLFAGNENSRPQVRQFIQNTCGKIARAINGAVLLCAHPSESGIQRGNGTCGSTAWNNTVRSRWYLKPAEDKDQKHGNHRILSRVKSNYAAAGEEKQIKWQDGVFINIDLSSDKIQNHSNCKIKAILQLIDSEALEGRVYTMNQFAEAFEHQYGFGSKRNIRSKLSEIAKLELIKFIKAPDELGIKHGNRTNTNRIGYGYIFTKNTQNNTQFKI